MVYQHKLSDQTQSYAAKIWYLPVAKCRDFLDEQLENYDRYMLKFDKNWTQSEKAEYERLKDTAENTFRALFCDRGEFESEGETIRTLAKSHVEGQRRNLVDTMVLWYKERLRGRSTEGGTSYTFLQGSTTAELRSFLDPLITPRTGFDEPSLWPLVEEVQVGVPSSRVLRYLTIHDLPGMLACSATLTSSANVI
jgi:hypothetical protein